MKLKTKEQLSVIEYEKELTKKELMKYRVAGFCFTALGVMFVIGAICTIAALILVKF